MYLSQQSSIHNRHVKYMTRTPYPTCKEDILKDTLSPLNSNQDGPQTLRAHLQEANADQLEWPKG